MGRLFGTDGVRGKANQYPMSPDLVLRLGQAIGLHFKSVYAKPRILIGKDTRRSGYMLEEALSAGICSVGVDVEFLGPLPTPGIAYLTRGLRACAGIVISASHNPFYDNGIKIFSSSGYKLPDEIEDRLEAMLDQIPELPVGHNIGRAKRIEDAIGQYAVFLKEQFPKHLSLEGIRIVIDCAHGSAYRVAPKVFEELGAELFLTGVEPNGYNINDNCGALHPHVLQEQVRLYKADIGLALDGDADRLIVVDDKGELVDGDQIMAVCAGYLKQRGRLKNNAIVTTVMSNMGLDIALKAQGIRVVRTQVGDRYVVEEMLRHDISLGGEQSGHLIFNESSTTGDGVLAGLHLMEVVLEQRKKLSELKTCMRNLPQVLKNLPVARKIPIEELPELEQRIKVCQDTLADRGRVLFRYSGTENLARIMIEGENHAEIEKMAQELIKLTQKVIDAKVKDEVAMEAIAP